MGGPWNTGPPIGVCSHCGGRKPKRGGDDLGTIRPDLSDNWRSGSTSATGSDFRRNCAALLASLVGTVALVRQFPLRRTPAGLTKTDLKGNHWVYGGVSTASATLTVHSRAGEVFKAHEAPARYRRDLRTIVKGDVQGPKHRPGTSPLSDGPAVVFLSKLKGVPVISTRGYHQWISTVGWSLLVFGPDRACRCAANSRWKKNWRYWTCLKPELTCWFHASGSIALWALRQRCF
jgi:hypothetical protein